MIWKVKTFVWYDTVTSWNEAVSFPFQIWAQLMKVGVDQSDLWCVMPLTMTENKTGLKLFFLCNELFNSCGWSNKVLPTATTQSCCFSMKTYYPRLDVRQGGGINEIYTVRPWNIQPTGVNSLSWRLQLFPSLPNPVYLQNKMADLPNCFFFQHKVLTSSRKFYSQYSHVYHTCICRGIREATYYFELYPQLKFKTEVICIY